MSASNTPEPDPDPLPPNFRRLVIHGPSMHAIDPEVETLAVQELEVLTLIYKELLGTGLFQAYGGTWLNKNVPTVGRKWTTIQVVKLPRDTELFTGFVLAGLLGFFAARETDTRAVNAILKNIKSSKVLVKNGWIRFPSPCDLQVDHIFDIEQGKAILDNWLAFYKCKCKYTKQIFRYKAALNLIPQIQDVYSRLASELKSLLQTDTQRSNNLNAKMSELTMSEDLMEQAEEDTSREGISGGGSLEDID